MYWVKILIIFCVPGLLIELSKINKPVATICGCCWVSLFLLILGKTIFYIDSNFLRFTNFFICIVVSYYFVDFYVNMFDDSKKNKH